MAKKRAKKKPLRILSEEFEEELKGKADIARKRLMEAEEVAEIQRRKFEEMVRSRPLAFVAGAFFTGLLLGALLAKRG